jgi:predicted transcriptional regulator
MTNDFTNKSFFSPNELNKVTNLLAYISENENSTQKEMASFLNCAPSMVNKYLKKLVEDGYVIKEVKSKKNVNYKITSAGKAKKNFLYISYLNELLQLFSTAKNHVEKHLFNIDSLPYKKIVFYGAGEVSSVILSVYNQSDKFKFNIMGIIDDDSALHGMRVFDVQVFSIDELCRLNPDVVIITSCTYENIIRERLNTFGFDGGKVKSFFEFY